MTGRESAPQPEAEYGMLGRAFRQRPYWAITGALAVGLAVGISGQVKELIDDDGWQVTLEETDVPGTNPTYTGDAHAYHFVIEDDSYGTKTSGIFVCDSISEPTKVKLDSTTASGSSLETGINEHVYGLCDYGEATPNAEARLNEAFVMAGKD